MAKIDLEKLICSLAERNIFLQDALKEQGLEYKDGEIVEIQKSKFKVGDWAVLKDGSYFSTGSKTVRIKDIIGREIWFETGTWASEDEVRHWTIEDAKPGDVLCDCHEAYDNPLIFILKKFEHVDFGLVRPSDYSSYCYLTAGDIQRFKEGTYHHEHNIKPATKEQRDLLFQKMKEAGYEWDSDKKELKKVDRTKDLSNYIKFLKSFHCWNKIQREIMDKYLEEQIKKNYSSKEDEKASFANRQVYNRAILTILSDYIEKYPDTRFGQMLYNLGIGPVFNEESQEIYLKLDETINKQKS